MKKTITILCVIVAMTANAQITKNVKSHTFKSGKTISEGSMITMVTGKNPVVDGEYLWAFQGGKMPIPENYFDGEFDGRQFEVKKVLRLKRMKNHDDAIVVLLVGGKKKFYCFVSQGIKIGELTL